MYRFLTSFLQPYVWFYLGLACTLAYLWYRRRWTKESRTRLCLLTLPGAGLILFSMPVVVHPLIGSLEWPYPPHEERPADAEALVVLDAGVNYPDATRHQAELDFDSMRRCVHAAQLYHQGAPCPVVVTGGYLDPAGSGLRNSAVLADFLVLLGVSRSDLVLEDRSLTTYESALGCRRLLEERGLRKVVLVTDATHMHRALGCFRKQGLETTPSACWYRATEFKWSPKSFVPDPTAADAGRHVFYEWTGIGYYWLRGRL